jgi:endogenous inhibitor of DNA gyrase (YacG/DUF329 family)
MDEDRTEQCPQCGLEVPWGMVVEGACPECGGRQQDGSQLVWVKPHMIQGWFMAGHWRRVG